MNRFRLFDKQKWMDNIGLKIMALVIAVFLWMIVVNVDNPIKRQTYTDIPVTIVNDDVITQEGNVYQVVGNQTVSVVVSAKRKTLQSINKNAIVATADIKEMDVDTGLVPIKVSISGYSSDEYERAEAVPRNLQIKTEKTGKKVLSLVVVSSDQPRDGYVTGTMTVNPEKITITGAASRIEQVERAVAQINVSGLSKDKDIDAKLVLYDADGNTLDQSQISNNVGEDGITVHVEILKVKSVPVVFETSGDPAEGYRFTRCISEPETIQICGREANLEQVREIIVPGTELDIEGASDNVEKTIDITPYLPENIRLVDDNSKNILVTAVVEENGTRTIQLLVSSIKINNLKDQLQVVYEPDAEIEIQFSGDEDQLEKLDITNSVSVDMKDITGPGEYDVPVFVDLPQGIRVVTNTKLHLTIKIKEEPPVTDDDSTSENSGGNDDTGNNSRTDIRN